MRSSALSTIYNSKSMQSEAYRILRTNLQFASAGGQLKTIVITSAVAGDGKSTTAINLAVTLAQSGKKVLIIDCDLRRSTLHKNLHISNKAGLTNVLAGMSKPEEVIKNTDIPGLEAVSAGPIPPNPAELLNSQIMRELVQKTKEDYDFVILDSPPAVAVTDGAILSAMADGTILVVAAGQTPIDMAQRAKENLERVEANILGVVLNKVELPSEEYMYYDYGGGGKHQAKPTKNKRLKKKGVGSSVGLS